jgi:hypothetical protein
MFAKTVALKKYKNRNIPSGGCCTGAIGRARLRRKHAAHD